MELMINTSFDNDLITIKLGNNIKVLTKSDFIILCKSLIGHIEENVGGEIKVL
jgi:hypothetical protein